VADEETRQLLRELLSAQKEYLELLRQVSERQKEQAEYYRQSLLATEKEFVELARRQNERYENQAKSYDEAVARYDQHRHATDAASRIASVIRSIALVGIAAVLAYLVIFGLHKH
jgi:ABC-type bacteriocin/lantibiotic exporter with double-glycine peptidase domain